MFRRPFTFGRHMTSTSINRPVYPPRTVHFDLKPTAQAAARTARAISSIEIDRILTLNSDINFGCF